MTIHYATGGLITPEKREFSTLCGRKFPRGDSSLMQSGYVGAKSVSCKDCRQILDKMESERDHIEKVKSAIAKGEWHRIQII